jgi:hypothetical protein
MACDGVADEGVRHRYGNPEVSLAHFAPDCQ